MDGQNWLWIPETKADKSIPDPRLGGTAPISSLKSEISVARAVAGAYIYVSYVTQLKVPFM